MSRRSNQKNQPQTKTQKPKLGQELIIDSEDTYKDLENVFYIHPSHLNMLKSLSSNQFNSVSIKNTNVDDLNAYNLINLYGKVQIGTNIEIIIYQPVLVLQMYDAKQIEANLKLMKLLMLMIKLKEKWKLYLFLLLNLKEKFLIVKKIKIMILMKVEKIVKWVLVKKELEIQKENNIIFYYFYLRIEDFLKFKI